MTDRPSERMRRRLLVWMTVIMLIVVIYTVACIFKVSVKREQKVADACKFSADNQHHSFRLARHYLRY